MPPFSGKWGPMGVIWLQVLPPSADFWMTAFTSPAEYPQLPEGLQTDLIAAAVGP
jgi:hypothetical protein